MVAKLKAQPTARKRRASVNLLAAKRKKLNGKDKTTRRHADDTEGPIETSKEWGLSLGDEFEGESYEEEAEDVSERSSSEEDGDGLDAEAEGLFPILKSESQERDLDSDGNLNEEQNNVQGLLYADRDEEIEALDKEYEEIQAQEGDMLHNLKGHSDEEVLKGRAVKSQKALWDKALEIRILLQKSFSNSNRLPIGDSKLHMSGTNKELENAFAKLSASSTKTLGWLHQTLKTLLNQNDSINKDSDDDLASQGNKKHFVMESSDDLDTIWQQISASYSRFVPFRNSTVDRWQRKTQLSSGAAASKSKLRVFNQSISQQIETHMRDFSRLLQRMCLKQSSVEVIGMASAKSQADENSRTDLQEDIKDFNGDPELIDDTEFYQELLREFLESSDPSSLGAVNAVRKMRNKNRKVVDRRASKGRKIRYNVHDKIVNFMAPIPMDMPPMAEKLFLNGLFRGGPTH